MMSSSDENEKRGGEDEEFVVEKIIGHKTAAELRELEEVDGPDDKLYFKVRWLGYAEDGDTWEDVTSLENNATFFEYIKAHSLHELIDQTRPTPTSPFPPNKPEDSKRMEAEKTISAESTPKPIEQTRSSSSEQAPLERSESLKENRKQEEDASSTLKKQNSSSSRKSSVDKPSTSSDPTVLKKKKKRENDKEFESEKKKLKKSRSPEPTKQVDSSLEESIEHDESMDSVTLQNSAGEEVYVVKKIVDHNPLGFCKRNGLLNNNVAGNDTDIYYRVRWEGYGKDDDTWEPDTNLTHLDVFKSYIANYAGSIEKCRQRWAEKTAGSSLSLIKKLSDKSDIFSPRGRKEEKSRSPSEKRSRSGRSRSRSVDSDEGRQKRNEKEKEKERERQRDKERKRREKEIREKEKKEKELRDSKGTEKEQKEKERAERKEKDKSVEAQKKIPPTPPVSLVEDLFSTAFQVNSIKPKKPTLPPKPKPIATATAAQPVKKSSSHDDVMRKAGSRSSSPVPKSNCQRLEKPSAAGDAKSSSKKVESVVIEASISTDNDKVPDDVFRVIHPAASTVPPPVPGVAKTVSFRYNNVDHTVPIEVLEQFLSKAHESQSRDGQTSQSSFDHQPVPNADLTELFRKQLRVSTAPLEAKQKIIDRFKREADNEKATWSRRLLMATRSGDFLCFQTTLEKAVNARAARDSYFKNKSRDVVSQAVVQELLRDTTDQEATLLMTLAWSPDSDNPCGDSNGHQTCRMLETLLSMSCSRRYLDKQTANGRRSALMIAAKCGQPCQVAVLVRYGAVVSLRDCVGQTALHYAAERGHMQIIKWLVWHGADLTLVGGSARTGRLLAEDIARHPLNGHVQVGEWLMQRRLALERIVGDWVRDVCGDVITPHRPITQVRYHRVVDQMTPRQQLITFVLDDYESLLQAVKNEHGENIRPFLFVFAAQYSRAENDENRPADDPAFFRIAPDDKRTVSLLQLPIAARAGQSVQLKRMDSFGSNTNSWSFAFSLLGSGETVLKLSFDLPDMALSSVQRALLVVQPWFCTVNDAVPL